MWVFSFGFFFAVVCFFDSCSKSPVRQWRAAAHNVPEEAGKWTRRGSQHCCQLDEWGTYRKYRRVLLRDLQPEHKKPLSWVAAGKSRFDIWGRSFQWEWLCVRWPCYQLGALGWTSWAPEPPAKRGCCMGLSLWNLCADLYPVIEVAAGGVLLGSHFLSYGQEYLALAENKAIRWSYQMGWVRQLPARRYSAFTSVWQ